MKTLLISALSAFALAACDSRPAPTILAPISALPDIAPAAEDMPVPVLADAYYRLYDSCRASSMQNDPSCANLGQYAAMLSSKGLCFGEESSDGDPLRWKQCKPRGPQEDYVDGYKAADIGCRDSSSPMSEDKAACQKRERYSKLLGSIKWCYGEGEHSSQTAVWALCKEKYAESDTNPATQELKNITLLNAGDLPWTSQFFTDLGPQQCLLTGFAKSFDEARMQIDQMEVKNGKTVIKEEPDRILFFYSDALFQKRMLRTVYKDLSTCEAEQRK